ncbi:MAG: VWA domain-containing protein [Chloroflexi bacterium]|nr:VWA domain-containing protein [Chloroflexota bacterium]
MLIALGATQSTAALRSRDAAGAPVPVGQAQDPLPDLIVEAGETRVLTGTHRFDEVIVRAGGRLVAGDYAGRPPDGGEPGGRLELLARRIEVEALGRISADGAGYRGLPESKGEGPGGGEGGITSWITSVDETPRHPTSSGAGGGYGGRGGDGVQDGKRGAWKGGATYGESVAPQLGSGGGAAPQSHHEARSLAGGDGGGLLVLRAEELVVDGLLSSDGEEGESGEFDAGGGGSGGGLLVEVGRIALRGQISARGGRGGRASNVGGSGGGGRIELTWSAGDLAPGEILTLPGNGPCPDPDELSPRACAGTLKLHDLRPRRIYLPMLTRLACIGPNRKAIALVMDVSGSMAEPTRTGRPAIAAAVEAAGGFLDRLTFEDRVALVAFDSSARLVAPLTADLDLLRDRLAALSTASGSRLDAGLDAGRTALEAARPGERRILVMLTDGRPSQVEAASVRQVADAVRAAGVRLYAIGIGAEVDASLLAEITGDPSRVFVESDAEELSALYHAIAMREGCPTP